MSKQQDLKEEIYNYVSKFNLSDDELKEIDTYVVRLLNDLEILLNTQDKILSDKSKVDQFKNLILEVIGDIEIG